MKLWVHDWFWVLWSGGWLTLLLVVAFFFTNSVTCAALAVFLPIEMAWFLWIGGAWELRWR